MATTELERLRRQVEWLKKKVARLDEKNGKRRMRSRALARDERLRRHFGAVNLGAPLGADNEAIDRELANEYGNDHREH